jgi:hypothetical protein
MDEIKTVLDAQLKGVTVKNAWQFFAGYSSLLCSLFFIYFSLKAQIQDQGLTQSRTDAIQDLRIDGVKRDIELQNLQIKDQNERFNELQADFNQLQIKK